MIDPDHIGMIAGALTTAAFVPQAWRVWRRRSADDLSLPTFFIFSAGVVCWLVYGFAIGSVPIILANAATLSVAASIIWMAVRFRER